MRRVCVVLAMSLCLSAWAAAAQPVNLALGKPVKASAKALKNFPPEYAVDGVVSDVSRFVSEKKTGPQWLEVDLGAETEVGSAHLYSGWGMEPSIAAFELQSWNGKDWALIPGTKRENNTKVNEALLFDKPVKTAKVRLYTTSLHQDIMRVKELTLWAPMPTGSPALGSGVVVKEDAAAGQPGAGAPTTVKTVFTEQPVMVNQSGYNLDWPKRFTAPLVKGQADFTITAVGSDEVLYRGKVVDSLGDFTDFKPTKKDVEYVITVTGGDLKPGKSDPFTIAPLWLERVCLNPTLRFMVDCRSVVGTHPSAFGACPWRDGTDYDFAIPSLVIMYFAHPAWYEQQPIEISWQKDKQRLMDPAYKFVGDGGGQPAYEAAKLYYEKLDPPAGDKVPDIAQMIHWGVGLYLAKAGAFESGAGAAAAKLLPQQTIEQIAFFLYAYPHLKPYFTDKFYATARDYVFGAWEKAGLLKVLTAMGDFKGKECPGHSIMPNLMLYEVAKREGRADADKYFQAALAQTQWVIEQLDFNDPHVTKGQRMSECKLPVGLAFFLREYPDRAPAGLRKKVGQWADIAIARSADMWDFRKYDDANWTLPRYEGSKEHGGAGWNEPGNIASFPGLCFAIADTMKDEPQKVARLTQLAASHFDDLFGRNPLSAHASERGPKDFKGVERGWPKHFGKNTCARIELCRGGLNSTAASEHYPFNPGGEFRHCEGWVNFNIAFNVGLAYTFQRDTTIELLDLASGKPLDTVKYGKPVKIHLRVPTDRPINPSLIIETSSAPLGAPASCRRVEASAESDLDYFASLTITEQAAAPDTLAVKKGDSLTLSYGLDFMRKSLRLEFDPTAGAFHVKP